MPSSRPGRKSKGAAALAQFQKLIEQLSRETGVTQDQLRTWFDNRKQKYRRAEDESPEAPGEEAFKGQQSDEAKVKSQFGRFRDRNGSLTRQCEQICSESWLVTAGRALPLHQLAQRLNTAP